MRLTPDLGILREPLAQGILKNLEGLSRLGGTLLGSHYSLRPETLSEMPGLEKVEEKSKRQTNTYLFCTGAKTNFVLLTYKQKI